MDTAARTSVGPPSESSAYDGFISYSHAADDLVAPRLQAGLQRFAKPWWKRRAVRIFRDESSLAANPHLWSSITEALDDSSWFVLLLSEDAASSEWVGKEIEHWIEHKPSDRILPVVTDGTFGWENGDVTGSSVPPALHGVFGEEPRWVDLRFARGEEHLDLQNPDFSAAIADVASAIRGVPKDELASEEVKQHRRTVRTAWAAGIAVTVLAVAAVIAGVFAIGQRNDARTNAELAESEATRANQEADRANDLAQREADAREEAQASAVEAIRSGELARARELAASAIAVLDADPVLSILLSLESLEASPEGEAALFESTVALRRAMSSQNLIERMPLPEESWVGALSPDGSHYVWLTKDSNVNRMLDLPSGEEAWVSAPGAVPAVFSNDGEQVMYGFDAGVGEDSARMVVVDADSGGVIHEIEIAGCTLMNLGGQAPDGSLWALNASTFEDCSRGASEEASAGEQTPFSRLLLLDSETLEVVSSYPTDVGTLTMTWLPDGERMVLTSFFDGFKLIDLVSGETLAAEDPAQGFWTHTLSPDGSVFAAARIADPAVWLLNTETLKRVDFLTGLPDGVEGMRFSQDGRLLIAGSRSEGVMAWDVATGQVEQTLSQTGPAWSVDLDPETQHLYVLAPEEISVWDLSGARQGHFGAVETQSWINGNSIYGNERRGAFLSFPLPIGCCSREVWAFDAQTGELEASVELEDLGTPAVLPDGRSVVLPKHDNGEVGPVVVWNPDDGSMTPLIGCRAILSEDGDDVLCVDDSGEWLEAATIWVDPGGTSLLIATHFGEMLTFDAMTLELRDRRFFDDGSMGVRGYGAGAIVVGNVSTGAGFLPTTMVTVVDERTFETVLEIPGSIVDFNADASLMAVHDDPGQVTIYDTTTWEAVRSFGVGESRIRGLEFSPDGTLLASGGTDGFLRVWDIGTGDEQHRIPIESPSDAFWLTDDRLAVGTSFGLWTTIALDQTELVEIAIGRLTRSFTPEECVTYLIDPCPSLDEIRSR